MGPCPAHVSVLPILCAHYHRCHHPLSVSVTGVPLSLSSAVLSVFLNLCHFPLWVLAHAWPLLHQTEYTLTPIVLLLPCLSSTCFSVFRSPWASFEPRA